MICHVVCIKNLLANFVINHPIPPPTLPPTTYTRTHHTRLIQYWVEVLIFEPEASDNTFDQWTNDLQFYFHNLKNYGVEVICFL